MSIKTLKIIFVLFISSILLLVAMLSWSAKSEVRAARIDPCKDYFDKAIELAQRSEKENFTEVKQAMAINSIAYTIIYEKCKIYPW